MHDDDTAIPGNLLEFRNLHQVQFLTLHTGWDKALVDVNITALIGGLQYLTGLKRLNLRLRLFDGFRANGATELFQGLEKLSSVNDLTLHLNVCEYGGLGNVTTKELTTALRNLSSLLKNVNLCISGIQGPSGVIELAEELTELHTLSLQLRWELRANDTFDEATIALANGIKNLHNLRTLDLSLEQNYHGINEVVSIL